MVLESSLSGGPRGFVGGRSGTGAGLLSGWGGEKEVSGEGIPGSGAGPDWRAVGSGSMGYHFMVDLYTDRVKI